MGVLCGACDDTGPRVVPVASIEVNVADTISVFDKTIVIGATLRDPQGEVIAADALRGRSVHWVTDHPEISISAVGPDSSRVTWITNSSTTPSWNSVTSFGITAAIDGQTATANGVICPGLQLAAHQSALLLPGRTASLRASVLGDAGPGMSPLNVLLGSARWTTSNEAVVGVDNSAQTATAQATGQATLIASACGVADTVDVEVIPSGYSVTWLGQGTRAIDINDAGEVLGIAGEFVSNSPRWLWRNGTFTPIEGCAVARLNNQGRVLCTGPGPTTWRDGVVTTHDTLSLSAVAINDSGHVLMFKGLYPWVAYLWRGTGQLDSLSSAFTGVTLLNNRGDIAGTNNSTLYAVTYVRLANGTMRGMSGFGRYSGPHALNDSGDVVGFGEGMSPIGILNTAVVSSRSGVNVRPRRVTGAGATNAIATASTGINNRGVVVGNGDFGAWVLRGGKVGLLSDLVTGPWRITAAAGINDAGVIIGKATNTETGESGAVVLTPQ